MTEYYMFIDESGDHGLSNIDPDFPGFLLCGVLMSSDDYNIIKDDLNAIKRKYWGNKEVIFHSTDIRKCRKEFQILFDMDLKANFYADLNKAVTKNNYTIIASAIDKEKFIKTYGKLSNDIYELSLSFIVERAIFFLDDIPGIKKLIIGIERRGKKEDKLLNEHFQKIKARGTSYVSSQRLKDLGLQIHFREKKENINGLQLSDLVAYPIITHVMNPQRANPAYDLISPFIYQKNGKLYGLKKFP